MTCDCCGKPITSEAETYPQRWLDVVFCGNCDGYEEPDCRTCRQRVRRLCGVSW